MSHSQPNYSFGYLVRRYRQALDLTQTDLARQVGCALVTISKIERDERRPSQQMANILAEKLSIPASERRLFIAVALGERAVDSLSPEATPSEIALAGRLAPGDRAQSPRYNLPAQTTQLVERSKDLAAVCSLLVRPEVRLLTLLGPAGAGKTRLSLAACAEILEHFADGVVFIPLAPVVEPELVDATIASALGVSEAGGATMRKALQGFLQSRELLLVLDNFEHLLPAAPLVTELLAAAPRLKILTSSRARLRAYGEYTYPVAPLSLPDAHALPTAADALHSYGACRLFVERAQAIQSDFNLTEENARAVAEICIQLDGLPLAIELAAARIRLLPPPKILEQLSHRLQFLTRGATDAPVRQRTLRDTIDWSYNLLEHTEQLLFIRLALFAGGCTLEAAKVVGNIGGEIEVLSALESLMDKSLLQQQNHEDDPRFSMLETFREYGLERLQTSGDSEQTQRIFAHYYLRFAAAMNEMLRAGTPESVLIQLEAEHDNLRAVLRWAQDQREAEIALSTASALWRFWQFRGYFSEGRRRLETALAVPGTRDRQSLAEAHTGAGTMAYHQGDIEQAVVHHQAALALYQELGDRNGVALALNNLGVQVLLLTEYERALPLLEQSLAIAREVGDNTVSAMALHNLADLARWQGNHARAATLLVESLELCRKVGHTWGAAHNLVWLAHARRQLQQFEAAAAALREGLQLSIRLNAVELIAECLEGSAALAVAQLQPARAATLWGAAEALRAANGALLPPDERDEYEQDVAMARAMLGAVDFNAAWAEGHHLSLVDQVENSILQE